MEQPTMAIISLVKWVDKTQKRMPDNVKDNAEEVEAVNSGLLIENMSGVT